MQCFRFFKNKRLLYNLFCLCFTLTCYSRNACCFNYAKIIHGGSKQNSCYYYKVNNDGVINRFLPYNVEHYRIEDGRVSIENTSKGLLKNVFLENMVLGKNPLNYIGCSRNESLFLVKDNLDFIKDSKQFEVNFDCKDILFAYIPDFVNINYPSEETGYNRINMARMVEACKGHKNQSINEKVKNKKRIQPVVANNYYSTDSFTSVNVNLFDAGEKLNSQYCHIEYREEVKKYTPYEVKEYGFNNGKVYIAKDVKIGDTLNRVFLERLVKDKNSLYYYRGKKERMFYLQKDTFPVIEIPKYDKTTGKPIFKSLLKGATSDYPELVDVIETTKYNKKYLTELVRRYNGCIFKPFPCLKYGLFLSVSTISFLQRTNNFYLDNIRKGEISVGFFLDKPITFSNFFFHSEVLYSYHNFANRIELPSKDLIMVFNASTINLPLLVRYYHPVLKSRTFINAGPIYTYHLTNRSSMYDITVNDNVVTINNISDIKLVSAHEIGISTGIGFSYNLNVKNILFTELRYNKKFGLDRFFEFNKNELHFILGISL